MQTQNITIEAFVDLIGELTDLQTTDGGLTLIHEVSTQRSAPRRWFRPTEPA